MFSLVVLGNTVREKQDVLLAGLFFLLFVSACHRIYTPVSEIHAPVAIPLFGNNTPEPLLGSMGSSIFKEVLSRRHIPIVHNPDKAEYILTGTINRIIETPRSLDRQGKGFVYRVTLGVTYLLTQKNSAAPVKWEDEAHADWTARVSDLAHDRMERSRALRQIFRTLSHRALSPLTKAILEKDQGT